MAKTRPPQHPRAEATMLARQIVIVAAVLGTAALILRMILN